MAAALRPVSVKSSFDFPILEKFIESSISSLKCLKTRITKNTLNPKNIGCSN